MTQYCEIIWTQSSDDETINKFFMDEIEEEEIFQYLKQWDYGGENEHTLYDELPCGKADDTRDHGENNEYVLAYNSSLGYIGLYRAVNNN